MQSETDGKIKCAIDGALVHSVQLHIRDNYPEWNMERYKKEYPEEPTLSAKGQQLLERARLARKANEVKPLEAATVSGMSKKPMHEIFELGDVAAGKNARGEPILISTFAGLDEESLMMIPDIDPNYVFSIDLLKVALIGAERNIPTYFWGYHGTGKTTLLEQVAARTGRPFMRVQHTINMEETDLTGNYIVKDGATQFELGPLAVAMKMGFVYCADEYDFAMPSVLSVYQPVLEGKPLVIKNAPAELRVIRPHKDFRFVATGNTNGGGDETGLYQGTQMQNAANYSRFGIVEEVPYMEEKLEVSVVSGQAEIDAKDALKIVRFAKEVRENFKNGKIGSTVSTRELITSAKLGLIKGSNWREGLRLGFLNRLSRVDKEVASQYAQRIFS